MADVQVQREPTVPELLRTLPHGDYYAKQHERQEAKLREARSIISDIVTTYAECFEPEAPKGSHERLREALEAGRQHIMACGFRQIPHEPFAFPPEEEPQS